MDEALNDTVENVFLLTGEVPKKEQTDIREKMNMLEHSSNMVLVATSQLVGEGFDLPRLDTLIMAMPVAWKELVGEIRDEFDADEVDEIRKVADQQYIINSLVLLEDIEDRFGIEFLESNDIDTIGGWALHEALKLSDDGEIGGNTKIRHNNHLWIISDMENYQIKEVIFKQNYFNDER